MTSWDFEVAKFFLRQIKKKEDLVHFNIVDGFLKDLEYWCEVNYHDNSSSDKVSCKTLIWFNSDIRRQHEQQILLCSGCPNCPGYRHMQMTCYRLSFSTNQNAAFVDERREFKIQWLSCRLTFSRPIPLARLAVLSQRLSCANSPIAG